MTTTANPTPEGWDVDHKMLQRVEHSRGSVPRTEWLRLADKYHCSPETIKGWSRGRRAGPTEPFQLDVDMLVRICQTKNVKAAWQDLHAPGTVTVGYHTFWRAWKHLDPAIRTGIMSTVRKARNKQLYGRYPTHGRNALWQADATMADNYVLPTNGTVPFRPWHEFVIDTDTRVMWMAVVDANPDAETQIALIGDAILGRILGDGTFVGGIPGGLQIDRGKDYLAEVVADGLARVPVPVFPCMAYEPFQKGKIERAIGTYIRRLGPATPGYVSRPGDGQRDPWHQADGRLLTFDEYVVRAFEFLDAYNNTPHSSLHGLTPLEAWRKQTNPIFQIDAESEEDLATLFLRKAETRRVSKNGVRFKNVDYFGVDLLAHVGEEVQLGYSQHDPSFLHVFQGDRWLMKLHPIDDASKPEMRELVRRRRKQIALVTRVQEKAATKRSNVAPADRGSASKVTRAKPVRPPKASRKGKDLLHRRAKPSERVAQ